MEVEEFNLPVNEYQTPLTKEFLAQYPDEVVEQFFDYVHTVPFIQNLISPNRKKAKDLPKDEQGRIIVDLTNPHIVENMDYFRKPALHFLEHGCYTFLRPNKNPQSEYYKFWMEERRRCLEGYVRESDGEWVTGYCYWFLNYNPMLINKIVEGTKRAVRVEEFPYFFEGIYWRFHYLHQARMEGKHAIELAKRGAHPYDEIVKTPDGIKRWGDIKVGDKLFGTHSNITTVIGIPYDGVADVYKLTLYDGREVQAEGNHLWNVGKGANRTLCVRTTYEMYQDPKFFDKKARLFTYAIPGITYANYPEKEVPIDAYTLGVLLGDGTFRHSSLELASDSKDINTYMENIPYNIKPCGKSGIHYTVYIPEWKQHFEKLGLLNLTSLDKFIPNCYKYNSKEIRLSILQGLMDTDGWCCKDRSPQFCTISERLKDDVIEIAHSLGYRTHCVKKKSGYKKDGVWKRCNDSYTVTICGKEELFRLPRKKEIAMANPKTFKEFTAIKSIEYIGVKRCKCVAVDAEDESYLIGDYIPTHNCAKSYSLSSIMTHNLILGESMESNKRVMTVLAAYQKEYLKDDKDGTLSKFRPSLNFINSNTPFPRLMLKNSPNEMSWQMGYKDEYGVDKGSFNTVMGVAVKEDEGKLRGKRGIFLFEEMGNMANLLTVYDTTRKSVEDGDYTFGQIYMVGTAAEDESDFASAKTLLYHPEGYNIYAIKNVYDKTSQGRSTFGFFYPAYVNRAGCYNKDGVSDVTKALFEILMARYHAKYGADPKSVLRVIAEDPITPAEAIIKVKNAFFPVVAISERMRQLETDPKAFDDVLTGTLVMDKSGKVKLVSHDEEPIRKWKTDNTTKGAVEIFELPQKDSNGNVYAGRYIAGLDPVDNDQAESSSFSSTFVLDLFTDRIVAEYTGRQSFADENFEITRLLCLFYNAKCLPESNKKGWFAYFQKMQSTHLLAPTPQYLRDKQLVKYSAFGSNAYGVNANAAINNYANGLIRDWLLKPTTVITKDENGNDVEKIMPQLYLIRNMALLDELKNFNQFDNFDRCVFLNTQISTPNGIKYIQDINVGDSVLTADGTYNNVYSVQQNKFNGYKYNIKALGDYRILECTDNHPILTRHSAKKSGRTWLESKFDLSIPEYKRADQLQKEDLILVPKRQNLNNTSIPEDLLYLLGWYISDGNVCHNTVCFFLQENQYEIGVNLVNIINKYYQRGYTYHEGYTRKTGVNVSGYWAKEPAKARIRHVKEMEGDHIKRMWKVQINSKELAEFLTKYGGTSNNKTICDELYMCKNLIPLLKGYFEGDGHYRCEIRCDEGNRNTLEVNSVYEELALKVRQILLDNDLWCTIRKVKPRCKGVKFQYNICLVNDAVFPIIEGSLKFKQAVPVHTKTTRENFIRTKEGFWVKYKLTGIEYVKETTYNISVKNNPSYIANGITTHNCRALGLVMLLREEQMIVCGGDITQTALEKSKSGLAHDDFFERNYNR